MTYYQNKFDIDQLLLSINALILNYGQKFNFH